MQFSNWQTEFIYQDLKSRYNKSTLIKKELAKEMSCSTSTIDLYISKGYRLPNYKKLGTGKNSRVVFNIIDVAEFLSQTIKVA
jgi:predicted DNA-binding transcriptional regulator AlpA